MKYLLTFLLSAGVLFAAKTAPDLNGQNATSTVDVIVLIGVRSMSRGVIPTVWSG